MELYVKKAGEPNYQPDKIQHDNEISMLLTQIETMLFTRKGEVLGSPDFGANLEDYVYELSYNDFMVRKVIVDQLNQYVPLAQKYNVDVDVDFAEEVDRHAMFIDITIDGRVHVGVYV